MKIAFLNFYSGTANRGAETVIRELAGRLAANHEVIVFQGGPGSGKEKYQVVTVRGSSVFAFTLKALPAIMRFKPGIVFPINGRWQALTLSVYCRLSGAKLVIAGHSGPGWDDRLNLLVKPDLFIALTEHQLAWAQRATIWKQKFALVSNGVDLEQFKGAGKKFHTDLARPIIMMNAASTLAKRVEQGIRAIARLKSSSLLLIGAGPLDKRIDKLGYELLGKQRFFHTSVSYELIPEYYRAADLFTLVSDSSEAFGIVYLEAMASGLPCIATDDESRREIIGKAGVFVEDPNDADKYAKAIEIALKKDWQDLPQKQAQKYSWELIAKKYEKVLAELVKKG